MNKKGIIIVSSVAALFAATTITAAVIISVNKVQTGQESGVDQPVDINYTDMQKVYYTFETEAQLDEIEQVAKKINENIQVKTGEDWGEISLEDSSEYINFNIVSDSNGNNRAAEDIRYYDRAFGKISYIYEGDYHKYIHYNGTTSNEFGTIEEAIEDHLEYTKYKE